MGERKIHPSDGRSAREAAIPVSELSTAVEILRAYGAKRVILFGSAARLSGDEAHTDPQDLDLACEGLPPDRFFAALGRLLSTLSVPVDLVDLQGADLRPSIRARIAREGVLLYEEA